MLYMCECLIFSYLVGIVNCTAQVDAVGYGLLPLKVRTAEGSPIGGIESAPVKKTRTSFKVTPT